VSVTGIVPPAALHCGGVMQRTPTIVDDHIRITRLASPTVVLSARVVAEAHDESDQRASA